MKTGKNFPIMNDLINRGISINNILFTKLKYPLLVLFFFSIFTGFGFNSLTNSPIINEAKVPDANKVIPTPIADDLSASIKYALQVPSSKSEELPTVKSDLDYVSYRYHSWDIPDEITMGSNFWIEINLTDQILFAYQGNQLINGFKVSTGTSKHKTVTGTFKIFSKYPAIKMTGPGYDLDHVPFTMFFYKGYAIHGTYWHNNFGTPMSHGCVNMDTDDAAWIYENAPVGTYIMVHY
jgi:hypothetical protein